MDKTKIVTFRMEEDLLEQLDTFTKTHSYWKRTFIIVALITAFFKYANAATRFAIIRAAFERRKNYVLKFEEIEPNTDNHED